MELATVDQLNEFTVSPRFGDKNADFIIKTSDNVLFKVHKIFLAFASGFFKDMFSLTQPASKDFSPETRYDVEVAEDSNIYEQLLCYIYPFPKPVIHDVRHLSKIIDIAVKYDVPSAIQDLRRFMLLETFLEADPLRLFAIAARYGFVEERLAALKVTIAIPFFLKFDVLSINELDHIVLKDFQPLVRTYHRGIQQTRQLLLPSGGLKNKYDAASCRSCQRKGCDWVERFLTDVYKETNVTSPAFCFQSNPGITKAVAAVPISWSCSQGSVNVLQCISEGFFQRLDDSLNKMRCELAETASEACSNIPNPSSQSIPHSLLVSQFKDERSDIQVTTINGTAFELHSCILIRASTYFKTEIALHGNPSQHSKAMPIIPIPTRTDVFVTFLEYIYPMERTPITDLTHLMGVLEASIFFGSDFLTKQLRIQLVNESYLSASPLRVYAVACNLGFQRERDAALERAKTLALETDDSLFDAPEVANMSSIHYVKLLLARWADDKIMW